MDLNNIFEVLVNADKVAAEQSPYKPITDFANDFGGLIVKQSPNYGIGENALMGLITGLVSGGSQNLTNDYVGNQGLLANEAMSRALMGGDITRPSGMNPSVFDSIKNSGNLFKLGRTLDIADDQRKSDLTTRNSVLNALSQANTPQQQQRVITTAKQMGLLPKDFNLGGGPSEPLPSEPVSSPTAKNLFPGAGLRDVRSVLLQEQLNAGLPGGAAQKEVADQMAAYKEANKDSVDTAGAARTRARTLAEIAAIAKAGVEGAGETGGVLGGVRDLASKAYALISPEETQQRASQALLDSVRPELIKANRSPGAVSDFESKLYLGAGPNSANTPAENNILIEKLANVATVENEYADFLDAYRAEKGTTQPTPDSPGAEKIWQAYKASNPPFITVGGKTEFNNDRTPWRQWIQQADLSGLLSGQMPTAAPSQTGGGKPKISKEQAAAILRERGVPGY